MTKASPSRVLPFRSAPAKDDATGRFLTGNSGGGRPAGSRNRLGEAFVADLFSDWQQHGADAIRRMCEADPAAYVRVVASLLPKHVALASSPVERLTDDELTRLIDMLRSADCA